MSFNNIINVSTYECKTLFRSWFFKIFSGIALLFLFVINLGLLGSHGGAFWSTRAIPANAPYYTILFLNVAQSIIAVFLAADFLRRDKKLDTTEVIYTRPVSNAEYVFGKTLGILALFLGLVVLALIIPLVFNLIRPDMPVAWSAYALYPLLISIPSLIFILGLSFSLMTLVKNQAVTFLILLGYIGVNLFYFQEKLFGLLDYMAFNLPMVYSDMIHFSDLPQVLLHRLAYASIGAGLIFATIRFLNRLPQKQRQNHFNLLLFLLFTGIGLTLGIRYYAFYKHGEKNREIYLALNNRYAKKITPDVISNKVEVNHQGNHLNINSEIWVRNENRAPLDTLVFSLNPGFHLDSVTGKSGTVPYIKEEQIIKIVPKEALRSHRRMKLVFSYSGRPDENYAYLDVPEKIRHDIKRIRVAPINKQYAFVSPQYVLLTPEVVWYPIAGVTFNHTTFLNKKQDFARFDLTVHTKEALTAISTGRIKKDGTTTTFLPDADLNSLSLIIGKYERQSVKAGKVEYNIYITPGHDFYAPFFENIKDTLGAIIKDEKEDYEYDDLDLYYSFKRVTLVETPVQFHAYERAQVQSNEYIQPEIILMAEKGVGLSSLDFARYKHFEEKRNKNRKQSQTEEDIEMNMLKRFLRNTFFSTELEVRGGGSFGQNSLLTYGGIHFNKNPYCAFPLYYSYVTGIYSKKYPLFNSMMEIYLKEGFEVSFRQTMEGGMSDKERANLALQDNSLDEIFEKWDYGLISSLVSQTGSFIIQALKNKVGISAFDNFLYYYLEDHFNQVIPFDKFARDFHRKFKVDIEPYFELLSHTTQLPAYVFSSIDFMQTHDEIGEVYLVKFKVTNVGGSKGMIDVSFRAPGPNSSNEQRLYEVGANETKDIQITLFDRPGIMAINTLISANIPSTFNQFLRNPVKENVLDTKEYDISSPKRVETVYKDEIIVDNEDEGFQYISTSSDSKIKQYINKKRADNEQLTYQNIKPNWTPSTWTPIAQSACYGEYIRSALVTRSGNGDNIARWTTRLPQSGMYDVYTYIPMSAMRARPGRPGSGNDRGGNQSPGQGQGGPPGGGGPEGGGRQHRGPKFADEGYEYNYTITSSESTETVRFVLENIEEGWNKIGSFHFPADSVTVTLTDKITGKRVFADAIKWVIR